MGTASRCHFLKNYIHVYIFLAFLTQLGYFQIKVRKNIYYARRFGRGVGGGGGGEGGVIASSGPSGWEGDYRIYSINRPGRLLNFHNFQQV